MVDYQIICKVPSKDGKRIERVGLVGSGDSSKKAKAILTTEELNNLIHSGNSAYYINKEGKRVEVSRFVQGVLRTVEVGMKQNTLDEMRVCRL